MNTAPDVITRYFAAGDRKDPTGLAACFTPDGIVTDEGATHRGRDEIAGWREQLIGQYTYTTTVTGAEPDGADGYLIRVRIEGDFPGGTADLGYRFTLAGDLITGLTIA